MSPLAVSTTTAALSRTLRADRLPRRRASTSVTNACKPASSVLRATCRPLLASPPSSNSATCGASPGSGAALRGPSIAAVVTRSPGQSAGCVVHARATTRAGDAAGAGIRLASPTLSARVSAPGAFPASERAAASMPTRSQRNGSRLSHASRICGLLHRAYNAHAARVCASFCSGGSTPVDAAVASRSAGPRRGRRRRSAARQYWKAAPSRVCGR